MRYVEFKNAIEQELRRNPDGLTWLQLQRRLGLPYDRPCPTWTQKLEEEISLSRRKLPGQAALVWRVAIARGPR
jgi:hypothetical protein